MAIIPLVVQTSERPAQFFLRRLYESADIEKLQKKKEIEQSKIRTPYPSQFKKAEVLKIMCRLVEGKEVSVSFNNWQRK